ncbi:MAG TPA: hypothetical protein VHA56_06345 [Mucilaginibacter sp.]|nr:hypothetical protein [Mucilaginibacter sp.]
MKKLFTLAFLLSASLHLFSQQLFTFATPPSANSDGFTFNNPAQKSDFAQTEIIFKIIVDRPNDLNAVTFTDNTLTPKLTLNNVQLSELVANGTVIIHINSDGSILGLPSSNKVPFPFNVKVTYNHVAYKSSGTIGNMAFAVTGSSASSGVGDTNTPNPPAAAKQTSNYLIDGTSHTGIAYYDALAIDTMLETGRTKDLYDYMGKFYFNGQTINTPDELIAASGDNPFFKDVFGNNKKLLKNGVGASSQGKPNSLVPAAIGNLDVTNLADGLAKFLIKRSKEELTVTFFNRFNNFITKYMDAQLLFPKTYQVLQGIGDQLYNYEAFINVLREAFAEDINGLADHLPDAINQVEYAGFFKKHGDLKDICLSSIYIANGLIDKQPPGKIIADFNTDKLLGDVNNQNVKAAVQTLQIFSNSIRSMSDDHYWVTPDSLKLLLKKNNAFKIYMGLVYIKAKEANISFTMASLTKILQDSALVLSDYSVYIRSFAEKAAVLQKNIQTLTKTDKDKLTFNDYYNFYNSALDMFQYAVKVSQLPGLNALGQSAKLNNFIRIARVGGNIAFDMNRKNYSSAILDIYTEYNYVFGDNHKLNTIIDDTTASDSAKTAAKNFLADKKEYLDGKTDDFKNSFITYGTFVAAVSQAKNSDEVENAIEAVALPSGSSSIKRETLFNVALNAYIGPYFGVEKIKTLDAKYTRTAGLTAPIGIAASVGRAPFLFFGGNSTSYSLFVSIIDIGALASYRLTSGSNADTAAAQIPTIQLKNIISPGAFFSIGIPKTPLSLTGGFQIGPNLRNVNSSTGTVVNTYADKMYTRWSISLAVDIPLLNFYTKSK